jgi:hypothetical protein
MLDPIIPRRTGDNYCHGATLAAKILACSPPIEPVNNDAHQHEQKVQIKIYLPWTSDDEATMMQKNQEALKQIRKEIFNLLEQLSEHLRLTSQHGYANVEKHGLPRRKANQTMIHHLTALV